MRLAVIRSNVFYAFDFEQHTRPDRLQKEIVVVNDELSTSLSAAIYRLKDLVKGRKIKWFAPWFNLEIL